MRARDLGHHHRHRPARVGQRDHRRGRGPAGHATWSGDAVRTGVTVLLPSADDPDTEPAFAGCHRLNGNGS